MTVFLINGRKWPSVYVDPVFGQDHRVLFKRNALNIYILESNLTLDSSSKSQ